MLKRHSRELLYTVTEYHHYVHHSRLRGSVRLLSTGGYRWSNDNRPYVRNNPGCSPSGTTEDTDAQNDAVGAWLGTSTVTSDGGSR